MMMEAREAQTYAEEDFKSLVFANNPRFYHELWGDPEPDEDGIVTVDENQVEWIQPQNEQEVEALLDTLKDFNLSSPSQSSDNPLSQPSEEQSSEDTPREQLAKEIALGNFGTDDDAEQLF